MSLIGKNILITGAARRVGKMFALAVSQAGGNVIIHYGKSSQEAERLRADIIATGGQAFLVHGNLGDKNETLDIITQAAAFGPIFALVNNASIYEPLTWDKTSLDAWEQHLFVNLTAPFLLSQAFARRVEPGTTGRIVNLLDWRALRPGPDHLPYTISKAALAALTRSLAAALAPQITVNGLALGAVLAPSAGAAPQSILTAVPAKRWAEPDEPGKALVFLLDGPAYITGEIVHLDGGRHLI
jgi:NAD(P)-dependent dehydrogenase (short-subunit alcohol dehydrogenase family)